MTRYFFVCLIATLCTGAAFPQVANVYVSTDKNIYAYDASSTGKLTQIKGSPFAAAVYPEISTMAVNGKYLFAIDGTNFSSVDSYLMESNGALKKVATKTLAPRALGFPLAYLFLDHTGATLYAGVYINDNVYPQNQSFNIEKGTGELNYTGQILGTPFQLTVSGNNRFAYGALCDFAPQFDGSLSQFGGQGRGISLLGFERLSDGVMIQGKGGPFPEPMPGDGFCPYSSIAAADPTNHVAFAFGYEIYTTSTYPPMQLAAYTIDSEGNLTTANTYKNMPTVAVGWVSNLKMAPSGKLLAVGGSDGLQVFHFNGASPITHFTGLLASGVFNQFRWDNNNHLYAINSTDGKLYVFTVTPESAVQEPGSPYTIPDGGAGSLIVQPIPR
jgi:hypothetical protein